MRPLWNGLTLLLSMAWALFGLWMATLSFVWGPNNRPGGWALAVPVAIFAVAPFAAWLYFNFGSGTPSTAFGRAVDVAWLVFAILCAVDSAALVLLVAVVAVLTSPSSGVMNLAAIAGAGLLPLVAWLEKHPRSPARSAGGFRLRLKQQAT